MKKFIIAALLSCFFAQAQIVFEKGYFINNNGQRTNCYIENVDWRNNPTTFNYKINQNDSEKKLENMMGVVEFGIDNESMYKRFAVKIERSPNDTKYLIEGNNPQWKDETLFLKALILGEANLYSYTDENIIRYFYETKQHPINQLVYIKYINQEDLKTTNTGIYNYGENIKENNQFRQQLLNSLQCETMSEADFKSLTYKKNALVDIFEKYNNCKGTAVPNTNYSPRGSHKSFAFRVTPGIYSASLKISDPNVYYNVSTDIKNEIIFKMGLEAEYILPFNKGIWSVFVNPNYQKFTAEQQYSRDSNFQTAGIIDITASANYASIEIPLGVRRYFFLNSSSKIFVNLAYVLDVQMSGAEVVFTNKNNAANANGTLPIVSRNNIAFGVGFSYNRFSAEIRMNTPRELSNYLQWSAKYTSTGITLGYQFL